MEKRNDLSEVRAMQDTSSRTDLVCPHSLTPPHSYNSMLVDRTYVSLFLLLP